MLALSTPAQEILTNLLPNLLRKIRIPHSGVILDLNAMRAGCTWNGQGQYCATDCTSLRKSDFAFSISDVILCNDVCCAIGFRPS